MLARRDYESDKKANLRMWRQTEEQLEASSCMLHLLLPLAEETLGDLLLLEAIKQQDAAEIEERTEGEDVLFCSINFHPFINHEADNVIKVNPKFPKVALKTYFLHRNLGNPRCYGT